MAGAAGLAAGGGIGASAGGVVGAVAFGGTGFAFSALAGAAYAPERWRPVYEQMKIAQRVIGQLLVLVLAASASGCTTMKTIRPAADPSAPSFVNVKAGDTIIVHLRDGRQVQVIVQRVDTDGVVSMEGVRYARSDISHLQRRSFSGWKTGLAIGGAVAGAYLVAAILVVVALDSLW